MTIEWDEFIESVESPSREWANSFDREALSKLAGDERERAIQLLFSRMNAGDPRVSRALGVLRDPRVRVALEAHLSQTTGKDKVATARALIEQAQGHAAALKAIKEGLANPAYSVAYEALNAAEVAGKPLFEALLATAVMHPETNIRVGAIMLALFFSGVNDAPQSWNHRPEIVALAKGQRQERRNAFATLCQLMGVDLNNYKGPRP